MKRTTEIKIPKGFEMSKIDKSNGMIIIEFEEEKPTYNGKEIIMPEDIEFSKTTNGRITGLILARGMAPNGLRDRCFWVTGSKAHLIEESGQQFLIFTKEK